MAKSSARTPIDNSLLACMSKLLFFGLLGSTAPVSGGLGTTRSVNVARPSAPSSTLILLSESCGEGWTWARQRVGDPCFLRHSIHRCMGCCAAWPMLCAGLREWVSAASLAGPFLLDQP